jgi:hypothetical protein
MRKSPFANLLKKIGTASFSREKACSFNYFAHAPWKKRESEYGK